jgi:hypothetical protein
VSSSYIHSTFFSLPRLIKAEVISGASTLLRTTEPAMEVKDGSMQRRELILFTDQYVLTWRGRQLS